jgi:dipeptidyl aminopeptidase/acylaminoacyl peptidase
VATIREFLEARTAYPTSYADDGETLLFVSNLTGTAQLHERAPDGTVRQRTFESEPVLGSHLAVRDRVLVVRDDGGNERTQLYLLGDDGSLEPLVVDPAAMHTPGGCTLDGRLLAYRTNRRNGVDFDVVVRDLDTGAERVVYDGGGYVVAEGFSPDAAWYAITKLTDRSGDNDLYLLGLDSGEVVLVAPHEEPATVSGPAWVADGSSFYFSTDVGRDTTAVARYDLATRSWAYVLEPGWETACRTDPSGTRLLVATNEEGWTRAELRDPASLELVAAVPLPGRGVCSEWTFSRDGATLAFSYSSPLVPGDVWALDTASGALTRLTESPSAVDPATLASPEQCRFDSFDGLSVPLFLYPPTTGPPERGAPVVVWVHGGPEGQSRPAWNPLIAYLASRGYAVCVPNVRGSTGYGKAYQALDDRRLRLDSVADLASLHDWLAASEGLDATRAALFGGSYGGYMVLAGLTFQPERWAAGVDVVGISSLVTFLENTSGYRRRFREREYGFLDTDREFLHEASPLTHVDRLRAPLLIIHGANDPRVPLSEAEQLHDTLARKGIRTELLVYPDEGHGLQKLVNRLDAYPRAVDFLDQVLAGAEERARPLR